MYLDYTGLRVRDLVRSLRFYARGLGLLEIRRGETAHGGVWVLLEDPASRQRLELNWYRPGTRYATTYRAGEELDHLGIRTDEPEELARHLVAEGAREVERQKDGAGSEVIFLADPDGVVLELHPTGRLPLPLLAT